MSVTKWVKQTVPDRIADYLCEVRYWKETDELDVYYMAQFTQMSHRAFSIPAPDNWQKLEDEGKLLQYAKDNIPDHITHLNIT